MEGRGKKNVLFQRKTGHMSETVRNTAKVTTITNSKWRIMFQMT